MGFIAGLQDTEVNRRGVEFSLKQIEPDLWKWQFKIGPKITTGIMHTSLMGMAAHRAQKRIDLELKKPRDFAQ